MKKINPCLLAVLFCHLVYGAEQPAPTASWWNSFKFGIPSLPSWMKPSREKIIDMKDYLIGLMFSAGFAISSIPTGIGLAARINPSALNDISTIKAIGVGSFLIGTGWWYYFFVGPNLIIPRRINKLTDKIIVFNAKPIENLDDNQLQDLINEGKTLFEELMQYKDKASDIQKLSLSLLQPRLQEKLDQIKQQKNMLDKARLWKEQYENDKKNLGNAAKDLKLEIALYSLNKYMQSMDIFIERTINENLKKELETIKYYFKLEFTNVLNQFTEIEQVALIGAVTRFMAIEKAFEKIEKEYLEREINSMADFVIEATKQKEHIEMLTKSINTQSVAYKVIRNWYDKINEFIEAIRNMLPSAGVA